MEQLKRNESVSNQEVISHRWERAETDVEAELAVRGAVEAHEQVAVLKELLSRYGETIAGTDYAADNSLYYHAEVAARRLAALETTPAAEYLASVTPEAVAVHDEAYRLAA